MIPKPRERFEFFLAAMIDPSIEIPDPCNRAEIYLASIYGNDVELPQPKTRTEIFLAKIAGMDIVLPTPRERVEFFLQAIADKKTQPPQPRSREEIYLYEWWQEVKYYADGVRLLRGKLVVDDDSKTVWTIEDTTLVIENGTPASNLAIDDTTLEIT